MVVVGFDVGKTMIYGAQIDRSGRVKKRYAVANSATALRPILETLRKRYDHLMVGSEATAEYHRTLAELCLALGIPFRLLNPITTKQFVRATVRKRKTDITDAEAIARVTLQGEGTVVTSELFAAVKTLTRTATKCRQLEQALKRMTAHAYDVMPEEADVQAAMMKTGELLAVCIACCRKRATMLVERHTLTLLCSIPGIGDILGVAIIAEVGTIGRFHSAKAFIAYIGIDPRVKQSGTTYTRNTKLTKRGSPYLRRTFFIAASVARKYSPTYQATYEKKRAEGRTYREATIVVARRLACCVYAVWMSGKPYEEPSTRRQAELPAIDS